MRTTTPLLTAIVLLLLAGCSQLTKNATVQNAIQAVKPTAAIADTRVTKLNFEEIGLTFDIDVTNPNPIAIQLANFDYQLSINDKPFLQETKDQPTSIAANSTNRIAVPVTLKLQQLLATVESLQQSQQGNYALEAGIGVNVPVLGIVRIPVSKSGEFAIPRMPKVAFKGIKTESASLFAAKMALQLEVENPNSFAIGLQKLDYKLDVNNQQWASSSLKQAIALPANGSSTITLPFNLSVANTGLSVLQTLIAGGKFDYNVTGSADATTDNPLLRTFALPFSKQGEFAAMR